MKVGAPLFAFFAKGGHDAADSIGSNRFARRNVQGSSFPIRNRGCPTLSRSSRRVGTTPPIA
jgi:hypothetical protein